MINCIAKDSKIYFSHKKNIFLIIYIHLNKHISNSFEELSQILATGILPVTTTSNGYPNWHSLLWKCT